PFEKPRLEFLRAVRRRDGGDKAVVDLPRHGARAGEEGRQAPEMFSFPARKRMAMALGTAESHAQETPGHRLGDSLRTVAHGKIKGCGARRGGVSLGGENCPGQLVERRVPGEFATQPGFEWATHIPGRRQSASPQPGVMLGEPLVLEEILDKPFAFAGTG